MLNRYHKSWTHKHSIQQAQRLGSDSTKARKSYESHTSRQRVRLGSSAELFEWSHVIEDRRSILSTNQRFDSARPCIFISSKWHKYHSHRQHDFYDSTARVWRSESCISQSCRSIHSWACSVRSDISQLFHYFLFSIYMSLKLQGIPPRKSTLSKT